jgi:hypothetical protein
MRSNEDRFLALESPPIVGGRSGMEANAVSISEMLTGDGTAIGSPLDT